jgi:hypothetical protein
MGDLRGRHDSQHNDIHHNDTRNNEIQHYNKNMTPSMTLNIMAVCGNAESF